MELILEKIPEKPEYKLLLREKQIGLFYMGEDGYYVLEMDWPKTPHPKGYINEFFLNELLKKFKELNEEWNKQIEEYFNNAN